MKNLRESYKLYKSLIKDCLPIKTYLDLNAEYNKFLIGKVLDGKEISLPSRMGTLSIVGKKQAVRFDENGQVIGLAPDWVKTKALWEANPEAKKLKKRIFHTNSHTGNIRYKYVWSKVRVLVENKTLYSLRLSRTNKRAVHKKIINGNQYKVR